MKIFSDASEIRYFCIEDVTLSNIFDAEVAKMLLLVASALQMITGVDFCCLKCIFTEQLRLENKIKNRGMISHRTSDNLNNKV